MEREHHLRRQPVIKSEQQTMACTQCEVRWYGTAESLCWVCNDAGIVVTGIYAAAIYRHTL